MGSRNDDEDAIDAACTGALAAAEAADDETVAIERSDLVDLLAEVDSLLQYIEVLSTAMPSDDNSVLMRYAGLFCADTPSTVDGAASDDNVAAVAHSVRLLVLESITQLVSDRVSRSSLEVSFSISLGATLVTVLTYWGAWSCV